MGLVGGVFKAGFGLASFGVRNFFGRAAVGALAGGYYAHEVKGYNKPEDIIKGMAAGAAMFSMVPTKTFLKTTGLAAIGTAGTGAYLGGKIGFRTAFGNVFKTLEGYEGKTLEGLREHFFHRRAGVVGSALGLTTKTAGWLARHPTLSLVGGSIGFLGYRFANPEESTSVAATAYNHMGDVSARMQDLHQSTSGLVQGLHAGRHGGW